MDRMIASLRGPKYQDVLRAMFSSMKGTSAIRGSSRANSIVNS